MKRYFNQLKKEIRTHNLVYVFLAIILFLAFFVRVYRVDQILGFHYDQGRDALVIWELIQNGKISLIGPTTGIEGIFRGPWYYWLITPAYFLGQGDPVWPSVFLSLTTVFSIFLIFLLGKKMVNTVTGLIAVTIVAFSYNLLLASRWLSNPTPMFLISMLLVFAMFKALEGRRWAWPAMAFLAGMAMQFGSAAETFYIPAILIFAFWQRQRFGGAKTVLISIVSFIIPFIPQIIFDFRHNFILLEAIKKFVFGAGTFQGESTSLFIQRRLDLYFDVFNNKLFVANHLVGFVFGAFLLFVLFVKRKLIFGNDKFLTLFLLLTLPLLGLWFFRGNYGNVYDYYFTGYYLIFVLLFSGILGIYYQNTGGKVATVILFFIFFKLNSPLVNSYINLDPSSGIFIMFGNQKKAVDYVYEDAKDQEFNVDVYVPPVIPYAYDYLFLWRGNSKYGRTPNVDRKSLLYTLYEEDPPHPERLEAWLARQEGIGVVEKSKRFGGITVERRTRISNEAIKQ